MPFEAKKKKNSSLTTMKAVAWEKYCALLSCLEVESNSSELVTEIPKLWITLAKEDSQLHLLC